MMNFSYHTKDKIRSFNVAETEANGIFYYKITIYFDGFVVPSELKILFRTPMLDADGIYTPLGSSNTEINPNWFKKSCESQITSGMPLLSVYSSGGENRFTAALSEIKGNIWLGAGVVEENCDCEFEIRLFRRPTKSIDSYSFTLRFDKRAMPYYTAIKDVKKWWEEEIGAQPCTVPEAAVKPVYSTWYNFHQELSTDRLLSELKFAKQLGFNTVIIDDGWQCDDNSRGYAFAGDWQPAQKKIGNAADFVSACHEIEINVIFWYSVPFIGYETKNYKRFEGKYLSHDDGQQCAILDPRFSDVRAFLIELYSSAVRNYGLDGLKLDFIDKFELTADSSTDYDAMDIPILEEAVFALMSDIYESVYSINENIMLEFRQKYIGPAICSFGNMLRVSDCPYSGRTNARSVIDLRLTSGNTPVHTDMAMWHTNTSKEDAARQLLLGLFAVPQISVFLDIIPEEHIQVIKNFIDYWTANKSILLGGNFSCSVPSNTYSYAKAATDDKEIILLIADKVITPDNKVSDVFNVTGSDEIYLDLSDKSSCYVSIYDCLGNLLSETEAGGNSIVKLSAPTASRIHLRA